MAKLDISKRAKFPINKQGLFIKDCAKRLGASNNQIAKLLNVSARTITDWKREKFLITFQAAKILGKKSGIKLPGNLKSKDKFWYTTKGAYNGGLAMYRKYGCVGIDPEYRKKKWFEWWKQRGKFKNHPILNNPLPINQPIKSEELAEFVGIILGDGGITKNQVTITLHHVDDEKYGKFIIKLIKKLFSVNPSIYHKPKYSVNNIVISRIKLVKLLTEKLGLKIGNKIRQQIDIPRWIKANKNYQIACIRGLMDTDGCLVIHKYKVNRKQYCYKKLDFCSASKPLIKSIMKMLKVFDFSPRLSHNGRNVWIDGQEEVKRYFQLIGSNNPKHKKRLLR